MFDVWLSLQLYQKIFDAELELLFTQTNSLTYEIKSEDVYKEFFKHKHFFDFGNFWKDSKIIKTKWSLAKWKMYTEESWSINLLD